MPKDHETPSRADPRHGARHARVTQDATSSSASPPSPPPPVDTARLAVVAEICRRASAELAAQGYRPEGRRELRRFGIAEICRYMLPLSPAELRRALAENPALPQGTESDGGQPTFALGEVAELRRVLAPRHARVTRPEGQPAKVVGLCNFKGGVAKTTTAAHLAMAAALDGLRVLTVDLDSQASMSALFGVAPDDETATAYAALAWDRARAELAAAGGDPQGVDESVRDYLDLAPGELIRPTHWPGIDILPAQLNLYWAEFQVPVWLQRGGGWRFWDALGSFLSAGGCLDAYDLVIVDTPPALGYLTINALAASDILLVPAGASFIEFDSTGRFFDMMATTFASIEQTLAAAHPGLPRFEWDAVQVVLTRYDDSQQADLAALIEAYLGDMVSGHRQALTALVGQAGERVSGLYEAPPGDFNPQTYRRGRASFDEGWAMLAGLLEAAWARGDADAEDRHARVTEGAGARPARKTEGDMP